jgi:hypothetical protein
LLKSRLQPSCARPFKYHSVLKRVQGTASSRSFILPYAETMSSSLSSMPMPEYGAETYSDFVLNC